LIDQTIFGSFLYESNMKNGIFLFVFFLSACQYADPVSDLAMCHSPGDPVAVFSLFANDRDFQRAHPSPVPVEGSFDGKTIEFPVEGGVNGKAYLVESERKSNKYLLLFHEWWGLNGNIKNEASLWSKELGVNVLAIDLYDGKVATNPDDAGKMMQSNSSVRSKNIILAATHFLGEDATFATMGWCFGGGWAFQAAMLLHDKTKACVMYYGMPEKDVEKMKALKADVLMVHATQDHWITNDIVSVFEANMKSTGKKLTVSRYDSDHAFANPSNPHYSEANAKAARVIVKSFLKKKF
jgi:carboxymethylenebutenolidase